MQPIATPFFPELHPITGTSFSRTSISSTDLSLTLKRASLAGIMLTLCGSVAAQGQSAILADGTALTIVFPHEMFTTEGAIFHLEPTTHQIFCTGIGVTVPASIDGGVVVIEGTSDGAGGEISAASFDRLLDANAQPTGRDAVGAFTGAARSIYATDRFEQNADPRVVGQITSQWASKMAIAQQVHPSFVLPTGAPTGYPAMYGGTCKSAGHVYEDGAGNRYYIPDLGLVIELAENVVGGLVTSHDQATGTFMVGNMLVMLNQDPRFPADVNGLGGSVIPSSVLWAELAINPNAHVDVIGHMIGEAFMFAQWIDTEFIDVTAPPTISAEQWLFRDDADRIRFRGFLDKPFDDTVGGNALLTLHVEFRNGAVTLLDRVEALVIDPVSGLGQYRVRSRDEVNVSLVDTVSMYATDSLGVEVTRSTWLRVDVE